MGQADRGQTLEQVADDLLDAHPSGRLPVVEGRAVTESETSEERPPGEGRRCLKILPAAARQETLQVDEIDPQTDWIKDDAGPVDPERGVINTGAKRGQRPPQGAPRGIVVGLRPEHRGEVITGERPSLDGQKRDDRQCLPCIDDDGPTGDAHFKRSKEADVKRRHRRRHRVTVLRRQESTVTLSER